MEFPCLPSGGYPLGSGMEIFLRMSTVSAIPFINTILAAIRERGQNGMGRGLPL
jgi:hypothetical protein